MALRLLLTVCYNFTGAVVLSFVLFAVVDAVFVVPALLLTAALFDDDADDDYPFCVGAALLFLPVYASSRSEDMLVKAALPSKHTLAVLFEVVAALSFGLAELLAVDVGRLALKSDFSRCPLAAGASERGPR